ncbi:MAG: alpha/beta fold hydrolase [Bacteroidales bacterium]|nr:alpha/beta fold hydrolase [Bacteroidales bacterium]
MKLFYRTYGTGHPIIILHGLFGMSDNWVTFGKQLAKEYEVFIPDLRNHGRSPHSNEFDYTFLLNDLVEFIQEQNLHDIILIGHSMGGKVAMLAALHHPEIIKKLIVLDISPVSKTPSPEIMQIIEAIKTLDLCGLDSRVEIKKQLAGIIEKRKIVEFLLKNIQRLESNTFSWKFNVASISENLGKIADGIETEIIFSKPTLVIGGEKSDYITGENIYQVFQNFPEARIDVISNAGHWLHVDAPEELLDIVMDFLRS